jgi:hypothetical protein
LRRLYESKATITTKVKPKTKTKKPIFWLVRTVDKSTIA